MTATLAYPVDGGTEGARRRDAAHELLRARRAVWVRRAQRALLAAALEAGTATADDVAAVVAVPDDLDGRLLGAAPGALVRAGLLRLAGYVHSRRPTRNASIIAVWAIADFDGAMAWLAAHPADNDRDRQQLMLFGNDETPTAATAGVSL